MRGAVYGDIVRLEFAQRSWTRLEGRSGVVDARVSMGSGDSIARSGILCYLLSG
jgi:hypothetical protein